MRPKSYIFEARLPLGSLGMAMRTLRCAALFAVLAVLAPRTAHALLGVGFEGGIIKRSASEPSNLHVGFVWGFHAELSLLSIIDVGPYYAHYSLGAADEPNPLAADATFNTLGL